LSTMTGVGMAKWYQLVVFGLPTTRGEEPEPRDGFDVGVDLDMQVGAMRPHGVLDRVSAVQALDAGDVVGVQEPMRAAVEGRHQRGRHGGVAQSERVAELMAGDRDEVDGASPGRDGDRPGLGLVEVRVPHDRSDRRRRHRGEERVGQNAAWSVEREAIPMVSGSELDDDLWPGRQCHRGEAQRGVGGPQREGLLDRDADLCVGQVGGEVLEGVAEVVGRPLAARCHERREVWRVGDAAPRLVHLLGGRRVDDARHRKVCELLEAAHGLGGRVVEGAPVHAGRSLDEVGELVALGQRERRGAERLERIGDGTQVAEALEVLLDVGDVRSGRVLLQAFRDLVLIGHCSSSPWGLK
jgi:hypothetical protein